MKKKRNPTIEAIEERIAQLESDYYCMLNNKKADCLLVRERIQGLKEALFFIENVKEN